MLKRNSKHWANERKQTSILLLKRKWNSCKKAIITSSNQIELVNESSPSI